MVKIKKKKAIIHDPVAQNHLINSELFEADQFAV